MHPPDAVDSVALLDIADSAYEEIPAGRKGARLGIVTAGGDALRERITTALARGTYQRVRQNGPILTLSSSRRDRDPLEFAALSLGHSFEDHAYPLVRVAVNILRSAGLPPLLHRGVQTAGHGFRVSRAARPGLAHVVVHGCGESVFDTAAAALRVAGYRVCGQHDGTGVLDVMRGSSGPFVPRKAAARPHRRPSA